MAVAATGIGLPNLDQRIRDGACVFVENAPMKNDPFANRAFIRLGIVRQQIIVTRVNVIVSKPWAGDFRDGILQ